MQCCQSQDPEITKSFRTSVGPKTTTLVRALLDNVVGLDRGLCLFQPLELSTGWEVVPRRLEALVLFAAIMLTVVLEGVVVCRIFEHPLLRVTPHRSFSLAGEWTGLTLPQGWLLGALLVLVYRQIPMFIPPTNWTDSELWVNRRAFLGLWRWSLALIAMQGLVLFLGHTVSS